MFLTDKILTPIRLLFRKDRESYFVLYRIMGFYPKNLQLYNQALVHKSYAKKRSEDRQMHNERLEYLGDAILDAVVGDIVFHHFKTKREGFLTNVRSKIVQRETLNRLAVKIGLDKLIKSSLSTNTHNSYMCGNAFEAFIGAIYLDRGYDYCMKFMKERILGSLIDLNEMAKNEINFKSKLIEWSQKRHVKVDFELVGEGRIETEACSPTFESRVLLEGIECGKGSGYSKKESQQRAAHKALIQVRGDEKLMNDILHARDERENEATSGKEIVGEESMEMLETEVESRLFPTRDE